MEESTRGLETGALSAKEALALAAAQAGIIAEALHNAAAAQRSLDSAAKSSSGSMQGLSRSAQSAHSSVSGLSQALGFLPGWGKVAALAVTGFAGAVDLANAAFNRYRAAGSLGLSTGQYTSFGVNAQQFLGNSALENAANAQSDLSKAGWLAALGISYDKATSESASDLAFGELKSAAKAYKSNPHDFMQTVQGRAYLALGGNLDDVRNASAHLGDLNNAWWRTNHDARSLNVSNTDAEKLTQFKIAVDRAKATMQTKLIDGLDLAAPALTHVTNSATHVANALGTLTDTVKKMNAAANGPVKIEHGKFIPARTGSEAWTDWKEGSLTGIADSLGWVWDKVTHLGKSSALHRVLPSSHAGAPDARGRAFAEAYAWLHGVAPSGTGDANNPLNERSVSGPFKSFSSVEQGIRSNASLLWRYGHKTAPGDWVATTIPEIIRHWAPPGDHNPTNQYIANVEKWSGVSGNLKMSQWTKAQFAAVIAAMSRQEGTHPVTREEVLRALYGHTDHAAAPERAARAPQPRPMKRDVRSRAPVHVSVTNSTSARVAVSLNAVAVP